jgi:hypothetical protein
MHVILLPAGQPWRMTKVEGTTIREPRERLCRTCVAPFLAAEPDEPRHSAASQCSSSCRARRVPLPGVRCRSELSFCALPRRRRSVLLGLTSKLPPPSPLESSPTELNSTSHFPPLPFFSATPSRYTFKAPSVIRQALFPYTSSIPNDKPSSRALLTIALLPAVDPRTHLRAQAPY